ncbi:hypothetical protein FRZ67_10230 [Panacibacter ginsenosidivorans]|uniref:Uncharacterized protein n=1 Tax=Panacibacter ginsenosidivorans TaxID=1813871 RepID=A0A5B8V7Y8_9BACT|nr:hypothetical protein [Panacibacter ginsenosidivorans]QEC67650.1 hypothetical protein FRZ67_10230 [Panacibacter ginsenosidivorans]
MEQENQLSEKESLQLISRMIHEAKGYFYESGIAALVYGFSILICSILTWLRDKQILSLPFHPFWFIVPIFFVQSFIQIREEKKKKAKTFTDEAINYIWMGYFLSVFAAFTASFAGFTYIIISVILLLTGLAVFLTGMISKFRYHIIAAFATWLLAAISFFIQNENIYILLAATAILVWIIPGFILNAVFKKQHRG